jgi:hypothetical protein
MLILMSSTTITPRGRIADYGETGNAIETAPGILAAHGKTTDRIAALQQDLIEIANRVAAVLPLQCSTSPARCSVAKGPVEKLLERADARYK